MSLNIVKQYALHFVSLHLQPDESDSDSEEEEVDEEENIIYESDTTSDESI